MNECVIYECYDPAELGYLGCKEHLGISESPPSPPGCSMDEYSYVDITGKDCEGWINLFFGEFCIAMISDVDLANQIKAVTKNRRD